jgi:phenylacetyl-CoA:acceptor oxidoreductase subunit 2
MGQEAAVNWLQRHWDARAAANFVLGGTGSGLLIFGALLSIHNDLLVGASLALMAAGLGAVWLEIGRKLRALHVFFNPFTSWMTRESFAAVLVFALGLSFLVLHEKALLYAAGIAAAGFLGCQAMILRAAKGIPAWRAPQTVPLIVATGLAEGAGAALFFSSGTEMLLVFSFAVAARVLAWIRYRGAVKKPALERAGAVLVWLGSTVPLLLLVLFARAPAWAGPLAGSAALAAGWWLKYVLVTRASVNQGFSLPHLPVRGAR